MNILFLMGVYPSYGGVEKVSTILANEFVNRGHKVAIVSFDQPNPEVAEQELDKRVELFSLSFPVATKINVRLIHDVLVRLSIDFIINQWAVPYKVARTCKKAMKGTDARLITVHHNIPNTNSRIKNIEIDIENNKGNIFLNRLKLWAITKVSQINLHLVYKASDSFVVLSESFIPILRRYAWLSKNDPIESITNPQTITPCRNKLKQNSLLYVGRIENNQKRTLRLLEIWSRIYAQLPEWSFSIIGDGPDRMILKQQIQSNQLPRVNLLGYQNPSKYYEEAKILLLVSEYEGYGLVISEAMSYGVVPIVLNSFPSCRDTITDDSVGIAMPYPFNADKFASKILELANDSDVLTELSNNAEASSSRFSVSGVANKWESLFKKLIKQQ